MIYKCRFKNLWSFAKETEVSFLLNRHVPESDTTFTTPREVRLSKLMAVQGANGAGKSNVLKALSFLSWFVRDSFLHGGDPSLMADGHILADSKDSEIDVEFELDGEHYRYLLVLRDSGVFQESLYRKTSSAFSYVFRRDRMDSGEYRIQQKGFDFSPKEAARVRANASLISTAAQYNVPFALKLAAYFFTVNSIFYRQHPNALFGVAQFFHERQNLHKKMVEFLKQVDLGLSDVHIEIEHDKMGIIKDNNTGTRSTHATPYGIHGHGDKKFELPFWKESEGTQKMLGLLGRILPVLEHGGIVILDELDASLHPDMVMAVLRLFMDSESNPRNTQIIFTSYTPDVMDTFLKEQILLVEKNPDGYSEAWRLDDIKNISRDENYYGKYRAGAYGATPDIAQ